MVNSDVLQTMLQQTPLSGREVVDVAIPESRAKALAIQIQPGEIESAWRVARDLLARTGRWPVVTNLYGDASLDFAQRVTEQDVFSRFYFQEGRDASDVSPEGLITASRTVNLDDFLRRLKEERDEAANRQGNGVEEAVDWQLEDTRRRIGVAPSLDEVVSARIDGKPLATEIDLERWLMSWERERGGMGDLAGARPDWFKDEQLALIWLPTSDTADVLAYISMYGASYYGSQNFIALLRRWHDKYRAELVAHFGTMLEFFVHRPPTDLLEAFELAVEHHLMAPCTFSLSGTTIRYHAAGLVGYDRWFLHERP